MNRRGEQGSSSVEYALLTVMIAGIIAASFGMYQTVNFNVDDLTTPTSTRQPHQP